MKAIGKRIINLVMDGSYWAMVLSMKDILYWVNLMVKENILGQMENIMMGNGCKELRKERVNI